MTGLLLLLAGCVIAVLAALLAFYRDEARGEREYARALERISGELVDSNRELSAGWRRCEQLAERLAAELAAQTAARTDGPRTV